MMKKLAFAVLLFMAFSGPYQASGQTQAVAPAERPAVVAGNASPTNEAALASVREQLFRFLRMSPRLTMAISNDPSLLGYQEYVNRHNPELAGFIQLHPEIARNPEFFPFCQSAQWTGPKCALSFSAHRMAGNRPVRRFKR